MRCNNCGRDGGESTGHQCPALMRPCDLCGSPDGGMTTHICPALTTPCRLCGSPNGGSTGHICRVRLEWPLAIRDQSGTAGAFAPRFVLFPLILLPSLTRWP